jgi:integrase/recombinase XerD
MSDLDTLHLQFLRERKYLRNLRPRTLAWHAAAWAQFSRSATHSLTADNLKRSDLEQHVYAMRDRGVKPISVNSKLRALCAFFRWLHTEGHAPTLVHLRPLKVEQHVVEVLTDSELVALVGYRPDTASPRRDGPRRGQKSFARWRVHVLSLLLLDTGLRLSEGLGLRVADLDLDDCLLLVRDGKAGKQRRAPFSLALRKVVWRWLQGREAFGVPAAEPLVFPSSVEGGAWDARNARRDFYQLQAKVGMGRRVGFHALRHSFATRWLANGGDLHRLSRCLGHSDIGLTSRTYVHLRTEDLSAEHSRVSPLSKGRTT